MAKQDDETYRAQIGMDIPFGPTKVNANLSRWRIDFRCLGSPDSL
ncbi:MAG: hypothetical protein NTV46_12990 [Verrucomicrobia bacterium]|nr:hypothetical protein [Verrucomicrobiota bacterium]